MIKREEKNIFQSSTFWGIVILLITAIDNPVKQMIREEAVSADAVWEIVQSMAGALAAVVGRYNAGDIYTTRGLPGKNKS